MKNRKEELIKLIEKLLKEVHQTELIDADGSIEDVLIKMLRKEEFGYCDQNGNKIETGIEGSGYFN